ncbi:MAG: LysE family translocator [Flavobacteriaceae bacterium]|jgi:threonine/homoserine/homoserine lactone efflux protein
MNDVLSALPFSVLLIFATGPLFFLILETSISKGIKPAFLIDLGAVFADAVFVLVAFLGTKSLLADIKDNPNLYILGGVLLMVYAIISAITTIRKKEEIIENEPIEPKGFRLFSYFIKGFFLNIINVGTFLFWLGLLVSIAPALELETSRIIVFFSTVMLGYLILGFIKIVLAKQLSKTLTPTVIYKIRLSVCVLLVVFGIYFIYQGVYAPEPDVLLPSINQWK